MGLGSDPKPGASLNRVPWGSAETLWMDKADFHCDPDCYGMCLLIRRPSPLFKIAFPIFAGRVTYCCSFIFIFFFSIFVFLIGHLDPEEAEQTTAPFNCLQKKRQLLFVKEGETAPSLIQSTITDSCSPRGPACCQPADTVVLRTPASLSKSDQTPRVCQQHTVSSQSDK